MDGLNTDISSLVLSHILFDA